MFDDILDSFFSGSGSTRRGAGRNSGNYKSSNPFYQSYDKQSTKQQKSKQKFQTKNMPSNSQSDSNFQESTSSVQYSEVVVDCSLEELYTGSVKIE